MPPIAQCISLPYYGNAFPIMSMAQETKYPIVTGELTSDMIHVISESEEGHLHIVKIVIDPPLIRVGAIAGCHIDRKWITRAVSSMVWARVCTIIPWICTNRNISAPVWFSRSIRWSVLYGRLGIAWFLSNTIR